MKNINLKFTRKFPLCSWTHLCGKTIVRRGHAAVAAAANWYIYNYLIIKIEEHKQNADSDLCIE